MGKKAQAAENIKVLVRCRPLSDKEKHNGYKSCVDMDMTANTVSVKSLIGEPDRWTFDAVINNTYSQKDIFTQYIQPLVDCVLDGFNATVFAYGQSGSGKTHTMSGVMNDAELEGVIPRCVSHIFESIRQMKNTESSKSYSMYVNFVELYNGKVRDLLAKQQVTLDVRESKDHTFYVQGANIPQVKTPEDIFRLMEQGTERRRTASTELNADSSRSHSIFTLILECTEVTENGALAVSSKLNLVDLAGSERQGKTGATGDTLLEGCNINLSLSALGTVIDTIVKGKGHIPFRSSQLTMLLKDSLGGNSKTVMFANINPSEHNLSETVSTLRFADRAKQIKNKPVVNMDAKDQKIAELTQLVQEMREKLQKYETEGTESLEREVERLREREGELQVSLDNAVKGRQADAVDFENAQAKFGAETQSFNSRMVEQEEQLGKLKNDLQIADTRIADASAQCSEILQICTTYLRADNPFKDADDLQHHLRELTSQGGLLSSNAVNKDKAEIASLQSRIQTLESENHTAKKEMKSKVKELEERHAQDKKSVQAAEAKAKKLYAELKANKQKFATELRNATTAAAATAAATANANAATPTVVTSSSPEELQAVTAALNQYNEKNFVNGEDFKKADERMGDLQRQHREVQYGVGTELSSLKKHLSVRRTEGDQEQVIQELQQIVHQSDLTISSLMAEVATSHQLLASMRNVMKQTVEVPLAVVSGDHKSAEESVEAMVAAQEQAASVQAQYVEKLRENLTRTTNQRNRLLTAVCDGEGNEIDIAKEVEAVKQENLLLQESNAEAQRRAVSQEAVAAESAGKDSNNASAKQPAPPATEAAAGGGGSKHRTAELEAEMEKQHQEMESIKKQLHDLKQENESVKGELEEERVALETQDEIKEKLYQELQSQREEISAAERRNAEMQERITVMKTEYDQKMSEHQHKAGEVNDLEGRLQKRSEQLNQLRKLLETQKTLIVRSNEKIDYYQQKLKESQQAAEASSLHFERLLSEKDENMQRIINQRMAEYSEACRQETSQKYVEIKKLKKKIKKLQQYVGECEEDYDKKVLECEELRNVLGEQKVEQLKLVRRMEHSAEKVEVMENKEHIQNALERAKSDRKRRDDLFDMGEVRNAKLTASRSALRSRGSDTSDGSWS